MANFKGGFAFNNAAAKAEVEQAPDGTLISCVNPVTGESLGGANNYVETFEGTADKLFTTDDESIVANFVSALGNNDISATIEFDLTAFSMGRITVPLYKLVSRAVANALRVSGTSIDGIYATINDDGLGSEYWLTCYYLAMVSSGIVTDGTAYASTIPTVTTIYHHPMS